MNESYFIDVEHEALMLYSSPDVRIYQFPVAGFFICDANSKKASKEFIYMYVYIIYLYILHIYMHILCIYIYIYT